MTSRTTITQDSRITVRLLLGLLITAVTATAGGAAWVARVDVRMGRLEEGQTHMIEALKQPIPDRWTGTDMRIWSEILKARNPTLEVPEPEHR